MPKPRSAAAAINPVPIKVQVSVIPAGVVSPQAFQAATRDITQADMEKLGDVAGNIQVWLLPKLRAMSPKPSSIDVEFGIDVHAEAGVVITKGSIGANFKVKMSWKSSGSNS